MAQQFNFQTNIQRKHILTYQLLSIITNVKEKKEISTNNTTEQIDKDNKETILYTKYNIHI